MKIQFLLITIFICCSSIKSQNQESSSLRNGYADSLTQLIVIIKEERVPERNHLLFCIPSTSKESTMFYSVDYVNENSQAFRSISKYILDYCNRGDRAFVERYLALSQFVDGYFAEDYFDSVGEIIQSQDTLYCESFNKLRKESVRRLLEIYETNCH